MKEANGLRKRIIQLCPKTATAEVRKSWKDKKRPTKRHKEKLPEAHKLRCPKTATKKARFHKRSLKCEIIPSHLSKK